jgi:metal-responsive CopG/Arc/MetJ family transcriptional regulator
MPKDSITIRLEDELIARLEEEAEEEGVSRSEYIRQILREQGERRELEEEIDTLRQRLETREARVEELEQQLTRRSQIEDKVEEVALEVREEREESNAPFFVKWYRWFRD